ncbi:MAG TPA: hypothetical protein VNH12_12895, partial [Burkholderiales bacterium]|nr:hypothetical protein [Burkholderiales bacterium]
NQNFSKDWGDQKALLKRNLLATLLLSRGVPMLLGGDELGHTQRGNNNAYCQDNEISWLKWDEEELTDFIAKAVALRKENGGEDLRWVAPEGREMADEDWNLPYARCAGVLAGKVLVLLNAHEGDIDFVLPAGTWQVALDTASGHFYGKSYLLRARSLAVLTPTS